MKRRNTRRKYRLAMPGILLLALMPLALAARPHMPPNTAAGHDGHQGELDQLLHRYDRRIEFTENKGQMNAAVLFKADFPLGQALATRDGMLMKAYDPATVQARQDEGMRIEQEMHDGKPMRPLMWNEKGHGWMLHFQNALPSMRIESKDAHSEVNNYFLGGKEAHNVRTYQEVWYTGVYRGIDVRYYPAADGSLEYDIVCAPNSDPRAIAIEFKGIESLRVNDKGELVVPTSLGEMSYPAPVVYQRIGGREKQVKAGYRVSGGNVLGFTLVDYDKSQPLVIDPIAMRWSTWVNTNSSGDNHGHAIWVDPVDHAVYVVARVVGTTDNITVGAFDVTANGNLETIVGKYLEPATVGGQGTRVWQTYIGGSGDDNPYAMEQGPDGNLYITGQTSSTNFPLIGGSAFTGSSLNQQAQSDIDVFVLKITQDGQSIKAAVVGGNGADDNFDVRTAPNGDVFVCGSTTSTNLLTLNAGSGASNTNSGGSDAFVFRINQDLSSLVWMRNYGGSSGDRASIMLHNPISGDLFVGGNTSSTNFPTVSPRQATRGGTTAGFLQRMNGTTAAITWSSYYSSDANDDANLLCMEFNTTRTELYFGGVTEGLNAANISGGAYDTGHNGSNDFYVGRMGIDQTFIAGTYVGGTSNEVNMMGLNTDLNNDVFVFGYSNSTNFPVSASPEVPLQTTNQGSNDKVFFKLESDLSALEFSTYYGGTNDDYDPVGERGIKFDNCRIYTIVTAQSNNLPLTQGALNTTKNSPTSRYEPGLVVWANPPDLLGNSITYLGTAICAGSVPGDIQGSQPSYVLPTVVRNNTASNYPAFPPAATFQWQMSTDSVNWTDIVGSNGQNLTGAEIGVLNQKTYIRRIIGGDACILAGAADQVVTVRIMSVTGDVTDAACNGGATGSITATADGTAPFGYLWSNGQTGQTATGLGAGPYSVTVTDANGCTAVGNFVVGEPTAVGGNVNPTNTTCGNSNGSASASGNGGTPGYGFLWSTGAVGANVSNLAAGPYSVTVTDINQCSVVIPFQIGSSLAAEANAGADTTITCTTGPAIQLNGSSTTPGAVFAWSGPGIVSDAGTANPTVNAAGTYTLLITGQNGCSATDQVEVSVNTTTPHVGAGDDVVLNCTTASGNLNGGSTTQGVSFAWTGPNGFSSSDEDPLVTEAGIYSLTVTDPSNGCSASDNAEVTLDDDVPVVTAIDAVLGCNDVNTTIQATVTPIGSTLSWTGPNGFSSPDEDAVVSDLGMYTLTATGPNGCTNNANAFVTLGTDVPMVEVMDAVLPCDAASTMIQATVTPVGASTNWAGPNGFISQDEDAIVSDLGMYTLTATSLNGCVNSANAFVTLGNDVPEITLVGATLTCTEPSATLQATLDPVGFSVSWTGPNGFTSTDEDPLVTEAGIYTLTATSVNGCTTSDNVEVILDQDVPNASATGGTLTCLTPNGIQLDGESSTPGVNFSWTGPNNFTSGDEDPIATLPGIYVLTVSNPTNGCSETANASVGEDVEVPGAQASGGELNCNTSSVMLSGSGNGDFAWTGPNGFTSGDQNPVVSAPGIYELTVTGTNGCTSVAQAEVTLDDEVPGAQASGGELNCNTSSVMLSGGGNGDFAWTGPNGFTSGDQNPIVSAAGTYVLTVTGTNGCTSVAQAEVTLDDEVPGAQASGGELNCNTSSVMLSGSGNGDFAWTGPNGFTSGDQNPVVSAPGIYELTVTGTNGCTSVAQAEVTLDDEVPGAQASGGELTCTISSVMLSGSGNGDFAWTGPNGFTSGDQNPVVSAPGIYELTVTGTNGCTSVAQAEVTLDDEVPGAQASGGVLNCNTSSVMLSGSGNGDFAWTGPNGFTSGDQNPVVSAPGIYELTVTGTNGCTSVAQAEVTLDDEVPGAQASGGELNCNTSSVMLSGSGNGDFAWTGPNGFTSGDQNPVVSAPGIYELTVTGTNGCTSVAQAEVTLDDEVPGAQASGGVLNCNTSSVMLSGSGNGDFAWTGPNGFTSGDQNPAVSAPGIYELTVTGTNGCTSVAQAEVTGEFGAPSIGAEGGFLDCITGMLQLDGSSTQGNSFSWSGPNGFNSMDEDPVVSEVGTYILTVTSPNGCTATVEVLVAQDCDDKCDKLIVECGPDVTIECGSSLHPMDIGAPIFRKDPDCPEVVVGWTDQWSGTCPYILTRTWWATDSDGNSETCIQTITVVDTQAPELIGVPADITVACSELSDEAPVVTSLDGCKGAPEVIASTEYIAGDCAGNYQLVRTWSATDDCGNTATATQTITVVDTQAPVLNGVPGNLTLECDQVVPDAPEVSATDLCSTEIKVELNETETKGDCPNERTIIRTWSATDACGNTAVAEQTISIVDTTAPVFTCVLANVTVSCDQIPEAEICKAIDNCDTDVEVTLDESQASKDCKKGFVIIRILTATDDCGNTTSMTQEITVLGGKLAEKSLSDALIVTAAPNPFRELTTLRFTADQDGQAVLEVVDLQGRRVSELMNSSVVAGTSYQRELNADGLKGGVYQYRLTLNGRVAQGRLVLTR